MTTETDAPRIEVRIDDRGEHGRVAHLTVSNPAKLNTLNGALMREMLRAVEELGRDDRLRCVVATGAGERAFVGGADIREMAGLDPDGARRFVGLLHGLCGALRALPVPAIARIRGHALGAGLELAASCDIRIAAEDAVFAMPEVRVGIPSVIEAALLPGLIGWGRTRDLLFTGRTVSADEALRIGLVEAVVPAAELDAAVAGRVDAILAAGPRAIRLQKALIRRWEALPPPAAVRAGIDCYADAFTTDEPRRYMAAFLDRPRRRRGEGGRGDAGRRLG